MVAQSSSSLDQKHVQLLWTYFQPLTPPLVMLWLWAKAVAHFERQQILYDACFPEQERKYLAPSNDLFSASRAYNCIGLGGLALCAWLCSKGSATSALLVPPLLYGTMGMLPIIPINVLRQPSRRFFMRTFLKVLLPVQRVGWADFLLADMLTSLAKSSSDMARSTCLMLHGEHGGSVYSVRAGCAPFTRLIGCDVYADAAAELIT